MKKAVLVFVSDNLKSSNNLIASCIKMYMVTDGWIILLSRNNSPNTSSWISDNNRTGILELDEYGHVVLSALMLRQYLLQYCTHLDEVYL
jgi:hypothetical protein